MVAGAIGVILGFPPAAPVVGLGITVAILFVLRSAARDIYRRPMDAVDPVLLDLAEQTLADTDGVVRVESVRVRWIGHELYAEASLDVNAGLDLERALLPKMIMIATEACVERRPHNRSLYAGSTRQTEC